MSVSFETGTVLFGRGQDAGRTVDAPDVLPPTSPTPLRSDAANLADELSKSAGNIEWPRAPELREFGQIEGATISAGYYNVEGLADACAAERAQLYKILAEGRAGWPRLLRKLMDAKSPPTEVEAKKFLPYEEVTRNWGASLTGIGEFH